MTMPGISNFSTQMELYSAPIDPDWILDGTPTARNRVLSSSTDRLAWTMLWDCSAGKFNWTYDVDETVHVIEGSVIVTDCEGRSNTLVAGDIAFFPKGTVAHWHVETYIRKVAFCQRQVPEIVALPLRVLRKLMNQIRKVIEMIDTSLANPEPAESAATESEAAPYPTGSFKDADVRILSSRSHSV